MPTRATPPLVFEAHQVHPDNEVGWTLNNDWDVELHNREVRNAMVRDMLLSGRSVQFRSSGDSLKPLVRSGDVTIWEPVHDHALLTFGDVVFCRVQESNRFYGHVIHHIDVWPGEDKYWLIGNLKDPPYINGWCYAKHIYGHLKDVSLVQPKAGRLYQPIVIK